VDHLFSGPEPVFLEIVSGRVMSTCKALSIWRSSNDLLLTVYSRPVKSLGLIGSAPATANVWVREELSAGALSISSLEGSRTEFYED
jgi:hypothetical protein